MTKRVIDQEVHIYDWCYLSLETIKSRVDEYIDQYGAKAKLLVHTQDDDPTWAISYKRMETDEEEANRINAEDRARQARKDMYLKLKKEFENEP